jgi:hypothetical protein
MGDSPPPPPQNSPPQDLEHMDKCAKDAPEQDGGVQKCPKKSWFGIRIVKNDDGKVVEALTLHLKIPGLGAVERVTSGAGDPVKIPDLKPGGKGDVKQIVHDSEVWEAEGDIQ